MTATATAETTATRPCTSCGGLLLKSDLAACPYCTAPLGGSPEPGHNAARLDAMREHESFPAAMEFDPPEGPEYDQATRRMRTGAIFLVLGGVLVARSWWFLGAILLAVGVYRVVTGFRARGAHMRYPLVRRPAIVTDRRSETAFNGFASNVVYQFTLELPDGAIGEFRFPGRGWNYAPLNRGVTGVAYTRGNTLIEFRTIKV